MLKTRLITALVLLPLVLLAILYLPPFYFACVLAIFFMIAAWEWSGMVGFTLRGLRIFYVLCVLIGLYVSEFLPVMIVLLAGFLMWLWISAGIVSYQCGGKGFGLQYPPVRSFIGFVVLIASWVALMTLKTYPGLGSQWLLLVLFIIWGADVGAYFAGRHFGKLSLASRVSPKKTWAGFFGGVALSLIIAALGGLFFHFGGVVYLELLLVAVFTTLFSVIGDLGISLVKRMSGVKDTGNIFPGHGGVLDRLDSVAAATVVFVLLVLWLGW